MKNIRFIIALFAMKHWGINTQWMLIGSFVQSAEQNFIHMAQNGCPEITGVIIWANFLEKLPIWRIMIKTFAIWSEGYAINGERGEATLHGFSNAETFEEACVIFGLLHPEFEIYFDPERMSYWGCKLFDNEMDARKRFG